MSLHHPFPFATALKQSLKNYNFTTFRQDLLAAFVVSLMALPLSMALSIAVGLPPQHGIYTAIVAGAIVPLLGGSIWQVSGPTAAFVVILAPIVSEHGLRGIIWAGLMAGVILLIMGFARLGKLIHYVPYPVTTGFTSGIAVVIATLALNDFLGLGIPALEGGYLHKVMILADNFYHVHLYTVVVGMVTLVLLFTAQRVIRAVPSAVIAVIVGTVLAMWFASMGHEVATIGSKFSYIGGHGETLQGVPPYPPTFHVPGLDHSALYAIPSWEEFRSLLFPALAIAILAALESLLSATVADSMAGTRHDPNAEVNAIGIGNIFSALAGGIPATGAIARTTVSMNNGAKTPVASSMHGILIMLYVLLLAPYIRYVPMAALAALLIYTAYRMSHVHQFVRTIRVAPRGDVAVLLVCFTLTVFIDMVAGVGVGMVCAAFLLIHHVAELTDVETEIQEEEAANFPEGTVVYRIRGPLFFGTVEKLFDQYQFTHDFTRRLVLDMRDVPFIDMTGLVAIRSMLESIAHEERQVCIVCNNEKVRGSIARKIKGLEVEKSIRFYERIEQFV